jgi:hemerythrin-like domain-containing protein
MLRDKNLIPLSHQHRRALVLCVRIERSLDAGKVDLSAWQPEIELHYSQEIKFHFAAEEQVLFPAANRFPELAPLVKELLQEHASLREFFEQAAGRKMGQSDLGKFAKLLSSHIRKEERELFEAMQNLMPAEDMAELGKGLAQSQEGAIQACILPQGGITKQTI